MKISTLLASQIISLGSFSTNNLMKSNFKILYDFNNNIFHLYENEDDYEIYHYKNGNENFIEGGNEKSPYFNLNADKLYYFGYSSYYYSINNTLYKIDSEESFDINKITSFDNNSYNFDDVNLYTNEIYYCDNYKYFEKINSIAANKDNACGIVALSLLLTYHDTFYDNRIVPDILYNNESLIKKADLGKYTDYSSLGIDNWKETPGSTQSFYNYLFDNYKHTIMGFTWGSNPMTSTELIYTFNDYINDNCKELKNTFRYYVNEDKPYESLEFGGPILLVLRSGDYKYIDDEVVYKWKYHIVTAYGYENGVYFVNGSQYLKSYRKIRLFNENIHSTFRLQYQDKHIYHSFNAYINIDGTKRNVCGCGELI